MINELYALYKKETDTTNLQKLEQLLLQKLVIVTSREVRRRTRTFRLTREDKEEIIQDTYLIFRDCLNLCSLTSVEDFEHSFMLCVQRHLRKVFGYKRKEELYGIITSHNEETTEDEELQEDYGDLLRRVTRKPKEQVVVKYIFTNRFLNRNYTLEQIAKFHKLSLNKVFKLERKLRELLKKKFEGEGINE